MCMFIVINGNIHTEVNIIRKLVTTALIYANGDIHIGHVRSTYLPADVFCRFNRKANHDVIFISGTDEYGTPISIQAEKSGVTPLEITDKYYKKDLDEFTRLGISFDNYDRTTRQGHTDTTQEFFLKLLKAGYVYEKTVSMPYCPSCDRFLPDRYVRGVCPHCGFEDARGDECDNCGRALADGELLNPVCFICKTPAIQKETTHWFLRLSQFQDWLTQWIKSDDLRLPSVGKHFLLGQYLEQELHDIAITRDLDWGIPVPVPNTEGKVLYVWFDAPIGYVDSTKQWAEKQGDPDKWKKYWLDPKTEIIHFIGKGILYHHSLFWPSVLKGIGWPTPKVIPAYGYATLEGFKLSKERGWVVNLIDFLDNYAPDSLRYYWLSVSPLKEDADFNWEEFGRKHNNELTDTLGNFIHRVLTFTASNFHSTVTYPSHIDSKVNTVKALIQQVSPESQEILKSIKATFEKVKSSIEEYEIRSGILSILSLARSGNKFFNDRTPWISVKQDLEHATETILVSLQLVIGLAQLCEPYLPFTSEEIWRQLGFTNDIHSLDWAHLDTILPKGHKIAKPNPIFQKIEDKTIAHEKQRLQQNTEKAAINIKRDEQTMDKISIDTFKKIQIITGKIVKAEPIKGSKKLLKIMVDLGENTPRQIVAGLAGVYSPQELKDRNVIVLANLKPAKLFNTMSNGMILAADNEGIIRLLRPDKDLPPGSRIL